MRSAILQEVIRRIYSEEATFGQRFELSKRKEKNHLQAKDYVCALYLKTYNNLCSAAFEQNLNEYSWEPKTKAFKPVLSRCQL